MVLSRKPFKPWIFSELIKDAKNYGYEFNFCLRQERGLDVFKNYVTKLYQEKSEAKTIVERNIAKLKLNYLYGLPSAGNERYI
jgi:hypothetical protein